MQYKHSNYQFHNRDISWLAFNHRVLLQATNNNLPLYERIKFLAIYHSNLDEFFRVRVAWIKSIAELAPEDRESFFEDPKELLERIFTIVESHYSQLDKYFYDTIIPELATHQIKLLKHHQVNDTQQSFLKEFARSNILPFIQPSLMEKGKIVSFLKNRALYLCLHLSDRTTHETKYAFVEIPTWKTKRFIQFPRKGESFDYIILDDAVRFLLPDIFPGYEIVSTNSFMVTRDAELYIDDEFSGNLVEKIKRSLIKRESGSPTGFIFDREMPINMLRYLVQTFEIEPESVIVGSKYLKMADFMSFPNPLSPELEFEPWPRLRHKNFDKYDSIFDAIKAKDRLLSVPYQRFKYVTNLLETASVDPKVTEIQMSLYRTSRRSKVARLLIQAARQGKKVTAFVEVKARFDEEANIAWAEEMRSNGVEVIYSLPDLKVHSKLILIARKENQKIRNYALISTGNFNRITAKLYCDHAYITASHKIGKEVAKVFQLLKSHLKERFSFDHLLVAPHHMRNKVYELIHFEMEQARKGNTAELFFKVNSLEDQDLIEKLYEASNAGVNIKLIVRGICCLKAGVKGQSENIEVRSIVDRYLEHARIWQFYHGGDEIMYAGSADLMRRNLSKRVEVMTPIYEVDVKKQLQKVMNLQWQDNVKARYIDADLLNRPVKTNGEQIQAQRHIHQYFKSLLTGTASY